MSVINKLKRALRGDVKVSIAALEGIRRGRMSVQSFRERSKLAKRTESARFNQLFARMPSVDLVSHFQQRQSPAFLSGFSAGSNDHIQRQNTQLVTAAQRIVNDHCWPLLGYGERSFGEEIEWTRDPLSGYVWPLEYHGDIQLVRGDGSDARVVWELNRLGHFVTLARAYSITNDERFAREFFQELRNWNLQNRFGFGINWTCAMEVALRAINLLAAFEVFRYSGQLDEQSLAMVLDTLHQHGTYISRNLEFSYIATSNHYLSDVVGLLWLGTMLPELRDARGWRDFGLREMLREVDKQILEDGADFESSTGYHRLVLEMLLYSFILCRANGVDIEERYCHKLHKMLEYMRTYMRPDGFAPLIGDSDSGQVLPIRRRPGDDHGYLLAIGAVVFNDPRLKLDTETPEELSWILGEQGVKAFETLVPSLELAVSKGFQHAGTYILRDRDLYLCFNTSAAGINGRGSHGHNDALSIEVSAHGRPFIVDPGTYVYSADLEKRHLFRSTAYHSTVMIDGVEQNTTDLNVPFVIGDEAHPRVLTWETGVSSDKVVAEHSGYARLPSPVTHRRSVTFNKTEGWWQIEDEFFCEGDHDFEVRFHFAPGLTVSAREAAVTARDIEIGVELSVCSLDLKGEPVLERQATSRDYGEIRDSVSACWRLSGRPGPLRWKIS